MPSSLFSLVAVLVGGPATALTAQQADAARPAISKPLHTQTVQQTAHIEALKLYALAMLRQQNNRLVEATGLLEEALKREPEAAPIHKALISLYLALGRTDEALTACRTVLRLSPDDYATWGLYAHQLKTQGRPGEAQQALRRGLRSAALAEHPDIRAQLLFDLGIICEELHDPEGAMGALLEVTRILDDPSLPLAVFGVGRDALHAQAATIYERLINLCVSVRQYDRALSLFAQARTRHPAQTQRLSLVAAKVHYERGELPAALTLLDLYLKTQPRNIEGYELRVAILRALAREGEILPSLERFADLDGENIALQLFLARQYAAFGGVQEAERVYEKLLLHSPAPEIYQALFTLYRTANQSGGMKKILDLVNNAIKRATKNEGQNISGNRFAANVRDMMTAIRTDRELAAAFAAQARNAVARGDDLSYQAALFAAALAGRARELGTAELLYRHCLGCPESTPQQFAIYHSLIRILWQRHQHKELVELCERGLQNADANNRILFHLHLSQVLIVLGRMDRAIAEARKAVAAADSQRRLSARLNLMDVLCQTDHFEDSLAEGVALLKDYGGPGDVRDIRLRLASVYSRKGEFEKSEEQLQLILKVDPNDATANNDLGYQWADRGKNLEEAERLIRKALELDCQQKKSAAELEDNFENAAFLDSLGWVLFRRGQFAAARDCLEKAVTLPGGSDDPAVWDHLGDVYFALDKDRAGAMWQKSRSLYDVTGRRKTDAHYKKLLNKLRDQPVPRP